MPVVTNLAVGAWAFTDGVTTLAGSTRQGVFVQWPVKFAAGAKLTVSKLPSGLKYAKKPVTDKKRGIVIPAGTIYGAPTAAKTYGTKLTVKEGKVKTVYILNMTVVAMPAELIGSYVGGSASASGGSATVKLTKAGKISGKWISGGKTWTLSAPSFDAFDASNEVHTATVTAKCKGEMTTLSLDFGVLSVDAGMTHAAGLVACASCEFFDAFCTDWKRGVPWKALGSAMKKATFTVNRPDAVLTAKVGSSGAVTVKGEFNVGAAKPYKKSAKGTLVPYGADRFGLFLYYPPKANKFNGYAVQFVLQWDGREFKEGL